MSRWPAVAILVDPPQSARLRAMVAAERALQKMASLTTRCASSPYAALRRHSSKVEAVCVNAHVRIRAGVLGDWHPYRDRRFSALSLFTAMQPVRQWICVLRSVRFFAAPG